MKDLTVLDNLIIGRVEPHIYAFTTNTIPNYLKVGDTYRPVSVRLKEWEDHYPLLRKEFERTAKVSEDTYFRDYSVHKFLEEKRHKVRLLPSDLPENIYYSKEFFGDTDSTDVEDAIADICRDYSESTQEYQFYNAQSHLPETYIYARTDSYPPRPNQQTAIDNFKRAIDAGRTNLLMYAVMRFGKSFTSMCCAVEMDAKLVVVVSAKADVLREWQKTVQSHVKFVEYDFLTSKDLERNHFAVTDTLNSGKRVVIFLTLQDLQGEQIKDRHREVFGQDIDLLLIDETHFGARAEKYGEVLKSNNYIKDVKNKRDSEDFIETNEADEQTKVLNAKVRIHLSGTPYRILMGDEFKKDDIIAFCQFTDIVQAQEEWDKEYVLSDDYKEWDNPYYGFPQMVRFAFNPNESSRRRLEELEKSGTTYAFSALLKPQSVKKDATGKHRKFVYEHEILDLLEVIDGSKEDNELLGFLDYDKIKDGKMCRHIVMVLPYCASCDAMEALIKANAQRFHNLSEYEIINISGVDNINKYKSTSEIKSAIRQCEENGKKTITLTVNRMLTGSTVEYWDTMLFLKDTASPQEYDQAIFRLQNPYIKTYIDDEGNTIKYNMKPQTLLVDFLPNRMFVMQEQKSMIYNVNVDEAGNSKLEERLKEELRISPIVVLNKEKIVEVKAADILQKISDYQKDKGIREEALEVPVDLSILSNRVLDAVMRNQNEIGSGAGFSTVAHEDNGEDDNDNGDLNVPNPEDDDVDDGGIDSGNSANNSNEQKSEENSLKKKIQSYYTRILLFAFITNDRVKSLSDIISVYDMPDNKRIAAHLGLDKTVLSLLATNINKFILSKLDYKIQDLNDLSMATDMTPSEKAQTAVNKFGKIGPAIVITPGSICRDMVALIPKESLMKISKDSNNKLLDIAGTAGEYAIALYDRLVSLGIDRNTIVNAIYTIPKSSICYELTRKLYELLGLNLENIATFYAEQMLSIKDANNKVDYDKLVVLITQKKQFSAITLNDIVSEGEEKVNFEAIVGNPPYQEIVSKADGNSSLGKQLFPHFIRLAILSSKRIVSLITPSKWFTSEGQDGSFAPLRSYIKTNNHIKSLYLFNDNKNIFSDVNIGAVNYFLYDKQYSGDADFIEMDNDRHISHRPLFEKDIDIIMSMECMVSILKKTISHEDFTSLTTYASGRDAFGIAGKESNILATTSETCFDGAVSVRCAYEKIRYIAREKITKNTDWIDKWKIFTSKGNGAAGTLDINQKNYIIGKAYIGEKGSVCTDSLIPIGKFDTRQEAENLQKYMATKFLRFMVGIMKTSRNIYQVVYRYVPVQDFSDNSDIVWNKSISKIDKNAKQKYGLDINEIDAQLYEKYKLTEDEIAFIESMIKPME